MESNTLSHDKRRTAPLRYRVNRAALDSPRHVGRFILLRTRVLTDYNVIFFIFVNCT